MPGARGQDKWGDVSHMLSCQRGREKREACRVVRQQGRETESVLLFSVPSVLDLSVPVFSVLTVCPVLSSGCCAHGPGSSIPFQH